MTKGYYGARVVDYMSSPMEKRLSNKLLLKRANGYLTEFYVYSLLCNTMT